MGVVLNIGHFVSSDSSKRENVGKFAFFFKGLGPGTGISCARTVIYHLTLPLPAAFLAMRCLSQFGGLRQWQNATTEKTMLAT